MAWISLFKNALAQTGKTVYNLYVLYIEERGFIYVDCR